MILSKSSSHPCVSALILKTVIISPIFFFFLVYFGQPHFLLVMVHRMVTLPQVYLYGCLSNISDSSWAVRLLVGGPQCHSFTRMPDEKWQITESTNSRVSDKHFSLTALSPLLPLFLNIIFRGTHVNVYIDSEEARCGMGWSRVGEILVFQIEALKTLAFVRPFSFPHKQNLRSLLVRVCGA